MSYSPCLLGVRRKKTDGKAGWSYEYQFLTSQEVTIVDDINDYQLFGDILFVVPQEEVLERTWSHESLVVIHLVQTCRFLCFPRVQLLEHCR